MKNDLTGCEEFLKYNPETGLFMRIKGCKDRYLGYWFKGNKTSRGYLEVAYNGVKSNASRVAWYLMTSEQPDVIDHINGVRDDNRFLNLRNVTLSENQRNRKLNEDNSTGYNGVYPSGRRFRARCRVNGRLVNLGTFDTALQAHEARIAFNKVNNFDDKHGVPR